MTRDDPTPYRDPPKARRRLAELYREAARDPKRTEAERAELRRLAELWERTLDDSPKQ